MESTDFNRRVIEATYISSSSLRGEGAGPSASSTSTSSSSKYVKPPGSLGSSSTARPSSPARDSSGLVGLGFSSPGGAGSGVSAGKRKAKDYGDRFIPTRDGTDLHASYALLGDPPSFGQSTPTRSKKRATGGEIDAQKEEANKAFSHLLKSELFGPAAGGQISGTGSRSTQSPIMSSSAANNAMLASSGSSHSHTHQTVTAPATPSRTRSLHGSGTPHPKPASPIHTGSPFPAPTTPTRRRLFNYSSPSSSANSYNSTNRAAEDLNDPTHEAYSLSPVTSSSQSILLSPRKPPRLVAKGPFKVLDAPDLADDYYLNLVDWSSTNVLGVGLSSCVYLWSANTSRVTKLCDLAPSTGGRNDTATSLSWTAKGNTVAVGTDRGEVQIWDAEKQKRIRTMTGHTGRVGSLAWNEHVLSSGSRDRNIYHRDTRAPEHHFRKLSGHRQEICGLKWNVQDNQLASGGNDNKLIVWNGFDQDHLWKFSDHAAAVKAIAWSPHQHGLLASGGGTADKKIRFWNTLNGSLLSATDTGSQVCNLMWSKTSNELVSTHGYSGGPVQNQVCIWRYPSMTQVATLTGHTYRVLYLAMSPDGQTICTGAGDETLRFWNSFQKTKEPRRSESSSLNPFAARIR